jgi:hypothetical protein
MLTAREKEELFMRARAALKEDERREVHLTTDLTTIVALIGNLQLALRHPQNVGTSSEITKRFVLKLIGRIDPARGDVYQFLMMGFDEEHDE